MSVFDPKHTSQLCYDPSLNNKFIGENYSFK